MIRCILTCAIITVSMTRTPTWICWWHCSPDRTEMCFKTSLLIHFILPLPCTILIPCICYTVFIQHVLMHILLFNKDLCETEMSHLSFVELFRCVYNHSLWLLRASFMFQVQSWCFWRDMTTLWAWEIGFWPRRRDWLLAATSTLSTHCTPTCM